jgi:hypothetical protein
MYVWCSQAKYPVSITFLGFPFLDFTARKSRLSDHNTHGMV